MRAFVLLYCWVLVACGGSANTCTIDAVIVPSGATVTTPPGGSAQFSLKSSVSGNCPLAPDRLGTWSTSDPNNTSIDAQGVATCHVMTAGSAPVVATISNSGTVRGHQFMTATLTCN
jgi:hypothetical protein